MGTGSLNEIVSRKLSGKKTEYSEELKKFAVTLQYYSTKAYNFVRTQFSDMLPHPRTISKWNQGINGEPGFTKESFQTLKKKVKENSIVICNLVVDEMSIKDKVEFDGKQFHGLVDMGSGVIIDGDIVDHATNALVFLVVGVNGHWKLPVGFFLIKGLNSAERANLMKICLDLLYDTGVKIHSLTFDGAQCNLSMCTKLGANLKLNNPNFSFPHTTSGEPIYLFYDPCHMLKLVRNTLGDKRILINSQGEKIEWEYIKKLYLKEKKEGLKVATKLTQKHVYYFNEKMCVRLASQVFSNSVSKALIFCQNLDRDFEHSLATAEFCLLINNAFDILNCRSKFSKSQYNLALSSNTLDKYADFISKFETYIYGLQFTDGTKIVDSLRKTGFIGLV